jgi:hypothetical protein
MKTFAVGHGVLSITLTPLAGVAVKNVVLVHSAFADGSDWKSMAAISISHR